MIYIFLAGGLIILLISGEILVRGATSLAFRFHISTLVVGVTIVSLGTSAPELFISLQAALNGHPDISIGNVIGSNIANLGLVLAITCILFPIHVSDNSIRIDWPVMMIASIVFYLFILNNVLEPWEGLVFIITLICFVTWLIRKSRRESSMAAGNRFIGNQSNSPLFKSIIFIILGCIGLAYGADWFVKGAVGIAENIGVSERVIALTIVAFGTSVPELVTSLIAAFKKQTDLSIGNLIGSNIFNILGILGITALVTELPVNDQTIHFDIFWMLGITAIILPFMISKRQIRRIEALVLLSAYVIYIVIIWQVKG